jgi:MSHA pilin protein MshC
MSRVLPVGCACLGSAGQGRGGQAGFTLVELVMVLVMLGVLAVYAVPRVLSTSDFYARGFHDQSMAYLRYAQKTAVAQRRTVCVTLGSNSLSLKISTVAGTSTGTSSCTIDLLGPGGEASLRARSGVAFSGTTTSFNFDALGQPVHLNTGAALASQTLQVANVSKSITVEAATGYVHE